MSFKFGVYFAVFKLNFEALDLSLFLRCQLKLKFKAKITNVVEQLSFSMFPSIVTSDFRITKNLLTSIEIKGFHANHVKCYSILHE